MPHYRDGTKAKIGDIVKAQPTVPGPTCIGPLLSIQERDTCNGFMSVALNVHEADGEGRVITAGVAGHVSYVTLKDCEKVA